MGWWRRTYGTNIEIQKIVHASKQSVMLSTAEAVSKLHSHGDLIKVIHAGAEAIPAIAQGLGSEDRRTKEVCVSILCILDDDLLGINYLLSALQHSNSYIRFYAADGIGILVKHYHDVEEIRQSIRNIVPKLLRMTFEDSSGRVQNSAGSTVLKLGDITLPVLNRCLADKNPKMRKAAIVTLAKIGPKAISLLPLVKHLANSDTNEVVRKNASKAIDFIEGSGRA